MYEFMKLAWLPGPWRLLKTSYVIVWFLKHFFPHRYRVCVWNSYVCLCALGNETRRGPLKEGKLYLQRGCGLHKKDSCMGALSLSGFLMPCQYKNKFWFLLMFHKGYLFLLCMFPLSCINTCSSNFDLFGLIQLIYTDSTQALGVKLLYYSQLNEWIADSFVFTQQSCFIQLIKTWWHMLPPVLSRFSSMTL